MLNTWTDPATVVEISRKNSNIVKKDDGSIRESTVKQISLVFDEVVDFAELQYGPVAKMKMIERDIQI